MLNAFSSRRTALMSAAALATLLAAAPALAANPPSADAGLQALRDYNLIVLGNMTSNSDVEGRALVGGNLSGSGTMFTSPHGQSTATLPGVVVGGNLSGNFNLNNSSGAWIGGNDTATVNLNGVQTVKVGGSVTHVPNLNGSTLQQGIGSTAALSGLPMSLADYATSLSTLSTTLAGLTTTQANPVSLVSNNLNINVTGGGTGLAVIDLNDSLLNGNQVSINTEGYDTVVINVFNTVNTADSYHFNPGTFSTNAQTKIIWNFVGATTLNVQGQFEGSILAPLATLTNNTQINGSVAVDNFTQGGEVHMLNYEGHVSVPEPAGWALMILGFGGVGGLLRRRRAPEAA
ncbi:collagen-binding domain-containing protein [Phenylobacterium sp.]|jgi:choice-of-anchor A domain-containing protein|uniref:collagen-binding domain-containing protein n=1 Tax=Phenylobacterium sp. TaxID=1871053 RepID=UPI002F4073F0